MKLLLALLALVASADAYAYTSASGNDPSAGSYDVESKVAVKSETALYSDAISKGHALYYQENALTGLYVASRYYSGTANAATAVPFQACIAQRAVATGDTGGFPCATRGYVDYARYDATAAIAKGGYLCIGTAASVKGVLVACNTSVISRFISLEDKASGSGSDLKVRISSQ